MMASERDQAGRLIRIDPEDPAIRFEDINGIPFWMGHAACRECGKDMPSCWDIVCHRCHATVCYAHARVLKGWWVCFSCEPWE